MPGLQKLFEPIGIRGLEIKNRLVMPSMVTNLANEDGTVSPELLEYYGTRADGGVGLIIVEAEAISWQSRGFTHQLCIHDDAMIDGLRRLTDRVHQGGAKIASQIIHCGRQTSSAIPGTTPVAPSPIPSLFGEIPRELTVDEILAIQDDFAAAAGRARRAGFDAVELHGAHGYLITEFFSPFSNHRTDRYGGGLRERARFAVETIQKAREEVGPDFPIFMRISAAELVDGGLTLQQMKVMAPMLVDAGLDAIHVSIGNASTPGGLSSATMDIDVAPLVPYAEQIKSVVTVPIIAVDRLHDVFLAEQVLQEGRADLIAMGRQLLADPETPRKALEGRFDDILPCIACNQGCMGKLVENKTVTCLVNPTCGRELEWKLAPAARAKKVVVVGGGPAGMEAARVAALRGHEVTLIEKEDRLGGEFLVAGMPHTKQAILPAISWLAAHVEDAGVQIELNSEATPEDIGSRGAEVVVVATGAKPAWPRIPGLTAENTVEARDVLMGRRAIQDRVVVVGGGATGLEVAHYLSLLGKEVTVAEMTDTLGADMVMWRKYWALKALEDRQVNTLCNARVVAVENECAVVERDDGSKSALPGPVTLVLCSGYAPTGGQWGSTEALAGEVHVVGDASIARSALEAMYDGARVGRMI